MSALVHDRTSTLHPEAVEAPLLFPVPQEANTFLEKGLEREASDRECSSRHSPRPPTINSMSPNSCRP